MNRRFATVALVILVLSLFACSSESSEPASAGLQGRMLLWHSWSGADAEVLQEIVGKFTEIHPQAKIKVSAIDPNEIRERFETSALSGLGPDLLIGPSDWLRPLAEQGLIEDITASVSDETLQRYVPASVDTLRFQGQLYGLPVSLRSVALYYNQNLVTEPARTLDELLRHAAEDKPVALNTNFDAAFWGVQAFGGRLFDESGRVALAQGGFANWLNWLRNAQDDPGMTLSNNGERLKTLFLEQNAAYYVDGPSVLDELRAALGQESVGVAPLPAGPYGNSGPFLDVAGLMFSTASSDSQAEIALELARFITNVEQGTLLMKEASRVPANVRVRVSPRSNPAVAGFVAQAKTAVPLPNIPEMDVVRQRGGDAYTRTLEGVQEPAAAAQEVTQQINAANGFEIAPSRLPCEGEGTVRVWHTWQGQAAAILDQIVSEFATDCPSIRVEQRAFEADVLRRELETASAAAEAPDLFIGPNDWIGDLAATEVITDVASLVGPRLLQRYLPAAVDTLRYDSDLYGLPLAMSPAALYYNRELVGDPARTLNDLLAQTGEETQFALNTSFFDAFWGVRAFGGRLFDEENRVTLDEGGFAEWLTWLAEAQEVSGMVLDSDAERLESLFKAGQAAYYVAGPEVLRELQTALGTERIGVVPLPAGPEGPAGPFLQVDGFLFSATSETQLKLALQFARHVTHESNQSLLMSEAGTVPVNINTVIGENSAIAGFRDQVETAVPLPNIPQVDVIWDFGNAAYTTVLQEKLEPAMAAAESAYLMNEANGFDATAPPFQCEGEGTVTLWHSWQDDAAQVLDEIIEEFADECPSIEVVQDVFGADELRDQFEESSASDAGPDLLIGPNAWIGDLASQGIITDVTDVVDALTLKRYLPKTVDALRYQSGLYGLPESLRTVALYYNRDLVSNPARTLAGLLEQASEETPVALDTSFYGAFWGISAFGGQLFDAEQNIALDEGGFAEWLSWLKDAQAVPGIVLDSDGERLQALFTSGEAAYYVGPSGVLGEVRAALGRDRVGVVPLPAGPAGPAGPFLEVDGFLFSSPVSEEQLKLAVQFANYATRAASQATLMREAGHLPANRVVDTAALAAITAFLNQARTAIPFPTHPTAEALTRIGDNAYVQVLQSDMPPAQAVDAVTRFLSRAVDQ